MESQDIATLANNYVIIPISFDSATYNIVVSLLNKNNQVQFYTNLKFFIKNIKRINVNKLIKPKSISDAIANLTNENFNAYYSNNSLGSWCSFELLEIINNHLYEKYQKTNFPTSFTKYLNKHIGQIYTEYRNTIHPHTLLVNDTRIRTTNSHFLCLNDLTNLFKTDIRNFFKTKKHKQYVKDNGDHYISGAKVLDELKLRVTFAHPYLAQMVLDWIVKKDNKKRKTHSFLKEVDDFIKYHLDNVDSEQTNNSQPVAQINDFPEPENTLEINSDPNEDEISRKSSVEECNIALLNYKLRLSDTSTVSIPVRKKDGYINATVLCKAGGKKFNDYHRLEQTQEYLNDLSKKSGYPDFKLIEVNVGRNGGTWVHRKIGIDLSRWISIKFFSQIIDWTDEILLTGKVELGKEASLQTLNNTWIKLINPIKILDIYDEKDVVYLFRFEPNADLMDEEIDKSKMYIKYGKSEGFKDRREKHHSNKHFMNEEALKVFDMPNGFKKRKLENFISEIVKDKKFKYSKGNNSFYREVFKVDRDEYYELLEAIEKKRLELTTYSGDEVELKRLEYEDKQREREYDYGNKQLERFTILLKENTITFDQYERLLNKNTKPSC